MDSILQTASHFRKPSQQKTPWTWTLRTERRRGLVAYVVTFSSGHMTATLRGQFGRDPAHKTVAQEAGLAAATDWLTHLNRVAKRPLQTRRSHYPPNKHHRKPHGGFRRAA